MNDARERGQGPSWPAARGENGPAGLPASARVGDRERDELIRLLTDAFADGRLTKEEFDARSAQALVARTGDDLAALSHDLDPRWLADRAMARRRAEGAAAATERFRAQLRSYIAVMALLVAVWLAIGLTASAWYPWFVWPALGWGLGLAKRAGVHGMTQGSGRATPVMRSRSAA
jgi:hypothetical protein